MKRGTKLLFRTILVLAIAAVMAVPTFASGQNVESGNKTVKVGFFAYPGYHEQDGDVKSGYGYDFLMLLQRYTNLNYEFVGYGNSWEDMQKMLQDGKIDMVTSARKTSEREEIFDFSEPIGTNNAQINVRSDDERFIPGDYQSLNGMTFGEIAGNSRNDDAESFAQEKGFVFTVKEFANADELEQALKNKEVDAAVSSSLRKTNGEKPVAEFAPQDFYVIVRKGDTKLLTEINYGISQMDVNEGNWRDNLYYDNYIAQATSVLSFTKKEQAYIKAVQKGEKTITVTARPDKDPYSFVENGNLTGIIPDYFAHLMDMAGLSYTTLIPEDRDEYLEWVSSDHADVVMDYKGEDGLITDPYMQLTSSRVTKKNFTGDIKSVATIDLEGTDFIDDDIDDDVEYVQVSSMEEELKAVKEGKADACYVYTYIAEKFINTDQDNDIQATILKNPVFNERIYVSAEADHELCSILNKCIKTDASGVLDEYVKKYTTVTFENITLMQYLKTHPVIILIVAAILLALIIIIAIGIGRAKTAKMKNAQLEQELETAAELNKNRIVIESLTEDFGCVDYVELTDENTSDVAISYRTSELLNQLIPGWKDEKYFSKKLDLLLEYLVYEPDKEQFYHDTRRAYIDEVLKNADTFFVNARFVIEGEIKYYQGKFSAVRDEKGTLTGVVAGIHSVDEQMQKEIQTQQQLEEALVMAQSANTAKTTFLNSMSHDIRTPMNAIIGYTGLAESHIDDKEKVKDYLEKIDLSSNHLLSLINDVLDMSRIESGKMNLDEKPENLMDIINTLHDIVQADMQKKQHHFMIKTVNVNDENIICDRLRLNQILLNILSNSIKYTAPGGIISLQVTEKQIKAFGYATYEFCITDNGMGMDEEYLKTIFDPFTRVESSTVSGIQGTGLGMAITKSFVEMMGGTIGVESEVGKGTTMTVTFDFRLQDKPKENADKVVRKFVDFTGKKVLLVEDNALNREIATEILKEEGFVVDVAEDGDVAVEMVKSAKPGDYEIILMDIQMPRMNGYEATKKIRELGSELSEIPIVAMTANAFEEDRRLALEAGMDEHIAKPIDINKFKETMAKFL